MDEKLKSENMQKKSSFLNGGGGGGDKIFFASGIDPPNQILRTLVPLCPLSCASETKSAMYDCVGSVAVISDRAARSKSSARCGRDPSEMIPRRQNPKSMTVSVILLITVFAFIIGIGLSSINK